MNSEEKEPVAPNVDEREPKAGFSLVPLWLVIAFVAVLYWGQLYLDQHSGGFNALVHEPFRTYLEMEGAHPVDPERERLLRGRLLYNPNCGVCHGDAGRGDPGRGVPPLAGADWVLAEGSERLTRIILHGLHGPIMVNDTLYDAVMPPFGYLEDQAVADILSYIRNTWGNKASMVDPEPVAQIRAEEPARGPWTADELLRIPVGEQEN